MRRRLGLPIVHRRTCLQAGQQLLMAIQTQHTNWRMAQEEQSLRWRRWFRKSRGQNQRVASANDLKSGHQRWLHFFIKSPSKKLCTKTLHKDTWIKMWKKDLKLLHSVKDSRIVSDVMKLKIFQNSLRVFFFGLILVKKICAFHSSDAMMFSIYFLLLLLAIHFGEE